MEYEISVKKDKILLKDESYIIVELLERQDASSITHYISLNRGLLTKQGIKNVTMYDKNNNILWNYCLSGYFVITLGVSASAISSTYEVTNYTNFWHFSNGSSTYDGNAILGKGTYKHKAFFITLKTVNIDITITADVNGNIY